MLNENEGKAEFNDAVGKLRRMNILFSYADSYATELDAFNWYHILITLQRELSTKMKDSEMEKLNSVAFGSLMDKIENWNKNKRMTKELYIELHNFENQLRKIYKDAGYEGREIDALAGALR
jgi:RNAse (barnase) inhibitor barstar